MNDWIKQEYIKYLISQKDRRRSMKIETMETVIKQIESELATDFNTINHILEDPAIVDQDSEKGIAYSIHERLHHVANHRIALEEAKNILRRLKQDQEDE